MQHMLMKARNIMQHSDERKNDLFYVDHCRIQRQI